MVVLRIRVKGLLGLGFRIFLVSEPLVEDQSAGFTHPHEASNYPTSMFLRPLPVRTAGGRTTNQNPA